MTVSAGINFIAPAWPAPATIGACFTTRRGGVSSGPWDSLNLADHVGDRPAAVARNRDLLRAALGLPLEPYWLTQTHSTTVVRAGTSNPARPPHADAAITRTRGLACVVMVADCLPLLLCSDDGSEVAAVHAGWRGLANGIIANAVSRFRAPPHRLHAWIGPCIGASVYPVGADVLASFAHDRVLTAAFEAHGERWLMDLSACADAELKRLGVTSVTVCGRCVYSEPEAFYSYRRDGTTGRAAALIWIKTAAKGAVADATIP